MKKILIVPLNVAVENHLQKGIDAFVKFGISKVTMLWHRSALDDLFDQYQTGRMTSLDFKLKIEKIIPKLKDMKNFEFIDALDSMCVITPKTKTIFDELKKQMADDPELEVFCFSSTNPSHIYYIAKQYGPIPGKPFFSYQKGKLGADLLSALLKDIAKNNPSLTPEQIGLLYTPPKDPYPQWGRLAWLFAPLKKWDHYQATQYATSLQKDDTNNIFTLIPFESNNDIVAVLKTQWPLEDEVFDSLEESKVLTTSFDTILEEDNKEGYLAENEAHSNQSDISSDEVKIMNIFRMMKKIRKMRKSLQRKSQRKNLQCIKITTVGVA